MNDVLQAVLDAVAVHDSVRPDADINPPPALNEVFLTTKELPKGTYRVALGVRPICTNGHCAAAICNPDGSDLLDVNGKLCVTFSQDDGGGSPTSGVMSAFVGHVRLPEGGKIAARINSVNNLTEITAISTYLTVERIGA